MTGQYFDTAHAYIRRKRMIELLSKSSIIFVFLCLLASTSAFIYEGTLIKNELYTESSSMVEAKDVLSVEAFAPQLSLQEEHLADFKPDKKQVSEKSSEVFEEEHNQQLLLQIEIDSSIVGDSPLKDDSSLSSNEKPLISPKIAKLIQATSSEEIDISQHYTVVG